ncbi:hypothetical protein PIB30_028732 [Stylosanthes scabra]|uniref:Uncharacterized protein n=1 Tax=Stylosanthes scabra TaxID=79078 RepID=A0ABU6WAP6_9FABA|nr:hypothetical protein [Stylosanthes scabra]
MNGLGSNSKQYRRMSFVDFDFPPLLQVFCLLVVCYGGVKKIHYGFAGIAESMTATYLHSSFMANEETSIRVPKDPGSSMISSPETLESMMGLVACVAKKK